MDRMGANGNGRGAFFGDGIRGRRLIGGRDLRLRKRVETVASLGGLTHCGRPQGDDAVRTSDGVKWGGIERLGRREVGGGGSGTPTLR